MKPQAFIFDIDGTLTLRGKRSPYDWKRVGEDTPNELVMKCLKALHRHWFFGILLFSGRDEICRKETERWLKWNLGPYYHELHMRPAGNCEQDAIIKRRMLAEVRERWDILGVFEDRKQVKRMWAEEGVFVFDVNQRDEEF